MPAIWRWRDALSLALPALIVTLLTSWGALSGINDDLPVRGWVIAWGVVAALWGGYAAVVLWRWRLVKRVAYVTKHGVVCIRDGGTVPVQAKFEDEVDRILKAWASVPQAVGPYRLLRGLYCWWKPLPFTLHDGREYAGAANRSGIAIGYDGGPLERTALGHELAHLFADRLLGDGSEAKLNELHAEHGVPY